MSYQTQGADDERKEHLYQLLIDAAVGYAIFTLDVHGKISSWNSGAQRLFGYQDEEIIGQSGTVIFTSEDQAARAPEQELRTAEERGQADDERWHVRKDGSRFFGTGLVFPLKDQAGKLQGFTKILRDRTERQAALDSARRAEQELEKRIAEEADRRHAETQLRHAQEDFQMLMDSVTEYAIVMLDKDGHVTDWNHGAEHILGYQRHEALGRFLGFIFTPEDHEHDGAEHELERARRSGVSIDDKWHMRKSGERFFSTGLVQPLRDSSGQFRGFAKIMRDNTQRRLAEEQANYLANHDVLTGLPNRAYFSTRLHQELANAQRNNNLLAVLLLDLNRFKYINDTMGHHTGDLLLKEVATRLSSCVRETDTVARLGGDEFVVIQTRLRHADDAGILAQKISQELSRSYRLGEVDVYSGSSIGISIYPQDAHDQAQLLQNADIAMYQAKASRRDGVEFYSEALGEHIEERKRLDDRLRSSLEGQRLEIHYQPQIDLTSWKITSVEALLRWKDPEMHSVAVADLIAIAEENGSIIEIGKWVLQAVCQQAREWRKSKLPSFRIAMNLSPLQFRDPDFLDLVRRTFEEYDMSPGCMEMEVTERLLVENTDASTSVLTALKSMGVQISVDDFGTGYSALSYLRDFPIDVIKIDQSLVQHLPTRRKDVAIATSVIGLAHNLGIKVIAEGVESTEQLAFLKAHDCTAAQGYLFHPPVNADHLVELMKKGHWSHMNPGNVSQ